MPEADLQNVGEVCDVGQGNWTLRENQVNKPAVPVAEIIQASETKGNLKCRHMV